MHRWSGAQIEAVAIEIGDRMRQSGWTLIISRSPVSASVYIAAKRNKLRLRVRISDHPPKQHVYSLYDFFVHPRGDELSEVFEAIGDPPPPSPKPSTHSAEKVPRRVDAPPTQCIMTLSGARSMRLNPLKFDGKRLLSMDQ